MEEIKIKKGQGRPKGSVKYQDDSGKPIGVYEWRKLQSAKRRQEKKDALVRNETELRLQLPNFVREMLTYLSKETKISKERLIQEAIVNIYLEKRESIGNAK